MDLSFLEKLTNTDDWRTTHWYAAPFTLTVNGDRYTGATDARLFVIVGEGSSYPNLEMPQLETIEEFMAENPAMTMTSLARLKDFVGPPPSLKECKICVRGRVKCVSCHGTGERDNECHDCGREHNCICMECEDGTMECSQCDDGKINYFDIDLSTVAKIYNRYFNKGALAAGLAQFTDDTVLVGFSESKQYLVVDGNNWRVVLMSLLDPKNEYGELKSYAF